MKLNGLVFTTVVLVTAAIVIGAVLYERLPDPLPTQFGLDGHPSGFTAKPFGVFVTPVVLALMGIVFSVLPRISPKGYRFDPFLRTYEIMVIAILALEFSDGMTALASASGYHFDHSRVVTLGIGLLLIVLGNFMGKVTRNFFVGIRNPWTLANEDVWFRTHRIGGVLFVIGGAVILISGFVDAGRGPMVVLAVVLATALFLTVYSYVLYRHVAR